MPSSPDDKLIEDGVQDFTQGLRSHLPLRHFGEFREQEGLKKMVEQQKESVFRKVFNKIWTREREEIVALMKKLNHRMDKEVIAEWLAKNREHEIWSVAFLQKWVDLICENFNEALEYHVLLNPDMEIESLKNYVERRKQIATNVFESIWKPGNSQMQEERKSKLEKQLQLLEEEVFEKRKRNLERKSVDGRNKLLGEVTTILLERSRQLKSYVDKHQGHVSTDILKGMVEEMQEYLLNGKGSTLTECHGEIHSKLVATLEGEIKFLEEEPKENITADDAVGYAERFDGKLRSCCFDDETNMADELLQDMNRRDPNEDPRPWMTMQEILNEIKEELSDSILMDLEETEPELNEPESNVDGNNDSNNVGDGRQRHAQSTEGKKRERRQPSRMKRSVKHAVSKYGTIISDATVTGFEVSPSKKKRTRCDVAKQSNKRSDGDTIRRSSRFRKATAKASDSISAQTTFPRRNNPRTKKSSHVSDLTKNIDETLQQNCYLSALSSPPSSNRMANKSGQRNDDSLKGSQCKPKSSKNAVSKTTRRASGRNRSPIASSGRAQFTGSGSKLHQASDEKVCPKKITFVKGDCPKYYCNVCKKTFKKSDYLKYHGEFCGTFGSRSFICDECGKGFNHKSHLVLHTRIHTGEKPFQCPKCPARFTKKANMQAHTRSHANEKGIICKPCNLTFISHQSLHEHNLTHEGRFPFPCSYCEKRFGQMNKLKNHVITHTDERPFKCSKCEASFAGVQFLLSHLESIHRQQKGEVQQLAYDASYAYLLKETKNESCRDIPAHKIHSAVVNYVIKKTNLLIPNSWWLGFSETDSQ